MHITRRTFLHSAVAAAVTVGLVSDTGLVLGQKPSGDILFPLPPETYSQPLYSMTAKQFESRVGGDFTAKAADGIIRDLVLAEVNRMDRLGNSTRGYYGESFSLIFDSKSKDLLVQDTYEISGPGFEQIAVLLVPIGREQKQYEVVINHLTR